MSFTPQLFIAVGADGHYFTLRETYEKVIRTGINSCRKEIWSFHHQNLAQDPDEAFAKAVKFSFEYGIQLQQTRDVLEQEMRDIKRANAEERAAREARIKQQQEEYEAHKEGRRLEALNMLSAGAIPFGRHFGVKFEDADIGLINWMMNKRDEFEEGTLIRMTADELVANWTHLRLPVATQGHFPAEEKEKITVNATVVRVGGYESQFGYVRVVTFVTDTGYCLVAKGKYSSEIGNKVCIKATVKRHGEYNEQKQTEIIRVKEM